MADKAIEKIIVGLIKNQLSLPNDYGPENTSDPYSSVIPSVITGFQNIGLSNTDKLQISVTSIDSVTIASNNRSDFTDQPTEIQETIQSEEIQIDMMSRNNDARDRRWEIITALRSLYSNQLQETENFKIFRMPRSFVNTSGAEGGSNINRYTTVFTCHVLYRKNVEITDYFETYNGRVDDYETVIATWLASETYNTDDEVYYDVDEKYYKCLNDGVTTVPTNVTDWIEITEPAPIIKLNQ